MLLSIKLLLGKLNTMQFLANVPCPVGVPPFLMAGFQESLVFGQVKIYKLYWLSCFVLICDALSLMPTFKQ